MHASSIRRCHNESARAEREETLVEGSDLVHGGGTLSQRLLERVSIRNSIEGNGLTGAWNVRRHSGTPRDTPRTAERKAFSAARYGHDRFQPSNSPSLTLNTATRESTTAIPTSPLKARPSVSGSVHTQLPLSRATRAGHSRAQSSADAASVPSHWSDNNRNRWLRRSGPRSPANDGRPSQGRFEPLTLSTSVAPERLAPQVPPAFKKRLQPRPGTVIHNGKGDRYLLIEELQTCLVDGVILSAIKSGTGEPVALKFIPESIVDECIAEHTPREPFTSRAAGKGGPAEGEARARGETERKGRQRHIELLAQSGETPLSEVFFAPFFAGLARGGSSASESEALTELETVEGLLIPEEVFRWRIDSCSTPTADANQDSDRIVSEGAYHVIVSPYCVGGDLLELLKRHPQGLPHRFVASVFRRLAKILKQCHANALALQDLSLENVLLAVDDLRRLEIKVCDPGQCVLFPLFVPPTSEDGAVSSTNRAGCFISGAPGMKQGKGEGKTDQMVEGTVQWCGNVGKHFRAPEVIAKIPYLASKVDVFCFGWSLWYFAFGKPIFRSLDSLVNSPIGAEDSFAKRLRSVPLESSPLESLGPYRALHMGDFESVARLMRLDGRLVGENWFESLCDLTRHCLHPEMRERPSFAQILEHPFLKFEDDRNLSVDYIVAGDNPVHLFQKNHELSPNPQYRSEDTAFMSHVLNPLAANSFTSLCLLHPSERRGYLRALAAQIPALRTILDGSPVPPGPRFQCELDQEPDQRPFPSRYFEQLLPQLCVPFKPSHSLLQFLRRSLNVEGWPEAETPRANTGGRRVENAELEAAYPLPVPSHAMAYRLLFRGSRITSVAPPSREKERSFSAVPTGEGMPKLSHARATSASVSNELEGPPSSPDRLILPPSTRSLDRHVLSPSIATNGAASQRHTFAPNVPSSPATRVDCPAAEADAARHKPLLLLHRGTSDRSGMSASRLDNSASYERGASCAGRRFTSFLPNMSYSAKAIDTRESATPGTFLLATDRQPLTAYQAVSHARFPPQGHTPTRTVPLSFTPSIFPCLTSARTTSSPGNSATSPGNSASALPCTSGELAPNKRLAHTHEICPVDRALPLRLASPANARAAPLVVPHSAAHRFRSTVDTAGTQLCPGSAPPAYSPLPSLNISSNISFPVYTQRFPSAAKTEGNFDAIHGCRQPSIELHGFRNKVDRVPNVSRLFRHGDGNRVPNVCVRTEEGLPVTDTSGFRDHFSSIRLDQLRLRQGGSCSREKIFDHGTRRLSPATHREPPFSPSSWALDNSAKSHLPVPKSGKPGIRFERAS